jgi:hypothetical protein
VNDDLADLRDAADAQIAAQLAAENADAEAHRPPEEPSENEHLPVPFGHPFGGLDVDGLRVLAPQIRAGLIDALRASATQLRSGRGTVVVPEDTYDLVRRLTAGEEVLTQWAQAFTDAAKEARALVEEEALTALGEYPGVEGAPASSLFVPDGEGQRIAVRPDWKPGDSTYDVATLVGWLIDEQIAEVKGARRQEARARYEARQAAADPNAEGVEPPPRDPVEVAADLAWYESDAREVAHETVLALLRLGKYTPGAKLLDELRKRLAGQQRDSDAGVIRQVRSVGPRRYLGVKITREEA